MPLRVDAGGRSVSPGEPAGPFVVWDLFDEELVRGKRTSPRGWLMPPPPRWLGESEDGMIMKAVALGWPDDDFPANAVVSERKSVAEAARFVGFD